MAVRCVLFNGIVNTKQQAIIVPQVSKNDSLICFSNYAIIINLSHSLTTLELRKQFTIDSQDMYIA